MSGSNKVMEVVVSVIIIFIFIFGILPVLLKL